MAKQSKAQKDTVERVMHEFKHGELESAQGRKVKNPKQAIAIALRESGSSNQESPKKNRQSLARTKRRERQGKTGEARAEGKTAASERDRDGTTKAELYERAKRKDIPGRSKMSKAELERAVGE